MFPKYINNKTAICEWMISPFGTSGLFRHVSIRPKWLFTVVPLNKERKGNCDNRSWTNHKSLSFEETNKAIIFTSAIKKPEQNVFNVKKVDCAGGLWLSTDYTRMAISALPPNEEKETQRQEGVRICQVNKGWCMCSEAFRQQTTIWPLLQCTATSVIITATTTITIRLRKWRREPPLDELPPCCLQ